MAEVLNIPMPPDLDVGPTYTLQVAAIDPTSGNAVSGVTVGTMVLTVDQITGSVSGLEIGPWFLVPGPGA